MKKLFCAALLLCSLQTFAQRPPKFDVSGILISRNFLSPIDNQLQPNALNYYSKSDIDLQLPANDAIPFNILHMNAHSLSAEIVLTPIDKSTAALVNYSQWHIGASYVKGIAYYNAASFSSTSNDTNYFSIWYNGLTLNTFELNTSYLWNTNAEDNAAFYAGLKCGVGMSFSTLLTTFNGNYFEGSDKKLHSITTTDSHSDGKNVPMLMAAVPFGLRINILRNIRLHLQQELDTRLFIHGNSLTLPSFGYSGGAGLEIRF